MKYGKQCMLHRGGGLPFNVCLYFLKDFKPPLKSCSLHSCGRRISQLFQEMQCIYVVYNTRSAAFRPRKRPYYKYFSCSGCSAFFFFWKKSFYWPQGEYVPPPSISGENCWPYSLYFANYVNWAARIGVSSGILI